MKVYLHNSPLQEILSSRIYIICQLIQEAGFFFKIKIKQTHSDLQYIKLIGEMLQLIDQTTYKVFTSLKE